MRLPNIGPRPHISQTRAIVPESPYVSNDKYNNSLKARATASPCGIRRARIPRRRQKMAQTPETILVVEDAEGVRKMVCSMLTQSGYNCLEASDGAEAVRLLESIHGVHLVLTD